MSHLDAFFKYNQQIIDNPRKYRHYLVKRNIAYDLIMQGNGVGDEMYSNMLEHIDKASLAMDLYISNYER